MDGKNITPVHFWTPVEHPPDIAESWDPDAEPARFNDGYSHAHLELYVRLSRADLPVTIGPDVPRAARVVVVFVKSLTLTNLWKLVQESATRPVVLVRSDRTLLWRTFTPEIEVMPNRSSCSRPNQVWLPLLPQRGLIPRDESRRGRVRTVGVKAMSYNVPPFLRSSGFLSRLRNLGLELRIDTEEPQVSRWHDFRDLDAILCVRSPKADISARGISKPPTKLINAWAAGCIPVFEPEQQYLEIARPNVDGLQAEGEDELIERLAELATERASPLVDRLEMEVARRRQEFSTAAVLASWWATFQDIDCKPAGTTVRFAEAAWFGGWTLTRRLKSVRRH